MISKKGQFYLIAAIIIIGIIMGFSLYQNSAKSNKGNIVLYDLGKELKIETGNVYDYGTYKNNNAEDTATLIENWTTRYYEYSSTQGSVEDWIFLYGDDDNMTMVIFSLSEAGSVFIDTGNNPVEVKFVQNVRRTQDVTPSTDSNEIEINFNGVKYNFKLEEGQNFFFVITGGESATS